MLEHRAYSKLSEKGVGNNVFSKWVLYMTIDVTRKLNFFLILVGFQSFSCAPQHV